MIGESREEFGTSGPSQTGNKHFDEWWRDANWGKLPDECLGVAYAAWCAATRNAALDINRAREAGQNDVLNELSQELANDIRKTLKRAEK